MCPGLPFMEPEAKSWRSERLIFAMPRLRGSSLPGLCSAIAAVTCCARLTEGTLRLTFRVLRVQRLELRRCRFQAGLYFRHVYIRHPGANLSLDGREVCGDVRGRHINPRQDCLEIVYCAHDPSSKQNQHKHGEERADDQKAGQHRRILHPLPTFPGEPERSQSQCVPWIPMSVIPQIPQRHLPAHPGLDIEPPKTVTHRRSSASR